MELFVVLLGLIIGLGLISVTSKKEQRPLSPTRPPLLPGFPSRHPVPLPPVVPNVQVHTQTGLNLELRGRGVSTKAMLETWRRSVTGLIRLAQLNLAVASQRLAIQDYKACVEAALTSVENVSRALLHCYGEKPEIDPGQEEALRILAKRHAGASKSDIEAVIEEIHKLYRSRIVHRYLSKHNVDFCFLLTEAKAAQILASATKIVTMFVGIMAENFATEIPELTEACPNCGGLDVGVLTFNEVTVNYNCNKCRHSWVQRRTF